MRLPHVSIAASVVLFGTLCSLTDAQSTMAFEKCPPTQWASSVKETSYDYPDPANYGRQLILGPPDATGPAQVGKSWIAQAGAANQFITVCYDKPQQLGFLEIYESYGVGRITKIKVANVNLTATWAPKWVTVYNQNRDSVCTPATWRTWRPALDLLLVDFMTNCVRIEADPSDFGDHWRIDAVGMIGDLPNGTICDLVQTGMMNRCDGSVVTVGDGLINGLQWATSAREASYDYPEPQTWGRERALGTPDAPGPRSRSWLAYPGGANQYITLCYDVPMWLNVVEVYENQVPCRIERIKAALVNLTASWNPQWVTVYSGPPGTDSSCAPATRRTWRPTLDVSGLTTKINCVRLEANPTNYGDYWAIDAVGISGGVGASANETTARETWLPQYPSVVPGVSGSHLGTQMRGAGTVGLEHLIGSPTAYPQWGISAGVWEPGNTKSEWAVVCFAKRVKMLYATLYETLSPGMVHTISGANVANVTAVAANNASIWTALHQGTSQFVPGTPGAKTTTYKLDTKTTFVGNCLRLELDGSSPWQYALDSVLLLGVTATS